MFSIKLAVAAAAVTLSGWMGFSWLTGVTDPDIYAFHDVEFGTRAAAVNPGSIVAVSPRGKISTICHLKADRDDVAPGKLFTYVYYNRLRVELAQVVRTAILTRDDDAGGPAGTEARDGDAVQLATAPRSGRSFTGRESRIEDLTKVREFAEDDCEAQMAWHLSKGYKACTVLKSLNAAVQDSEGNIRMRTVAVAFAERSNFVMESKFEEEGIPYNKAAQDANGQSCEGSTLPWIAQLRHRLQIITRAQIATSA